MSEAIYDIEIDGDLINTVYLSELDNMTRTQIAFGGASSGKSYFYVAQRPIIDLLQGGRNYLMVRKVKQDLRDSVFAELTKLIDNWGLNDLFSINQSTMAITCVNGYQILFRGLDKETRLKSITPKKGILTDIVVEEATEVFPKDLSQLNKRLRGVDVFDGGQKDQPKRLTILFNPILKTHHIYETYFIGVAWTDEQTRHQDAKLSILKTTYKDNAFLTPEDIEDLENEPNEYYYNVYTLGNWGVLGEVIFPRIKIQDLTALIAHFDNIRDGLDFGYANDPVAYVKLHIDKRRKKIYIFYEDGGVGWSDEHLTSQIKKQVGRRVLWCDNAEPKSIDALRALGIDARGAKKGPDSVRHGIKWLQGYTIIIHSELLRTKREFEMYQWKKDRNGVVMMKPIEKNDHWIDATRYGCQLDMRSKRPAKPVNVEL